MKNPAPWSGALLLALAVPIALSAADYTRLTPLPAPRVVAAAEAMLLNAGNPVEFLVDGNPHTEYASAGRGLDTFVEFDFGTVTRVAGFRHQDRKNGTIAGSELTFFDDAGREVRRVAVTHPDRSSAVTFVPIWPAVEARKVRWQVTKLGAGNAGAVGGAEMTFFGVGGTEARPTAITLDAVALPIATRDGGGLKQPLQITVDYPYVQPADVTLKVANQPPRPLHLEAGPHPVEFSIPTATQERRFELAVSDTAGAPLAHATYAVPAFREITIYIVPHSHVDIGFTEIQTAIEEKQLNNLLTGIAAAKRTANYPEGSRFVWNLEGGWAADLLLRRLDPAQRDSLIDALRHGGVALNGMYFNTLTGLCRPEELTHLFRFATDLRTRYGIPMEAAMISDVPGYTWGTVTAMAQAGIKYFCAAPNIFDRIGDTYVQWENKPFWWVGPSGRERVLAWVPFGGYNLAARIGRLTPEWVSNFTEELVRTGYPYTVDYIRWSRGDNAAPDTSVSDQVRDWNASHAWPRFVISSARDAFRALEQKHGAQLPEYRGDWTPYWEDGAGSSALQTAMNRASSDRLAQADALWAMQAPGRYPAADFTDAWRSVLLYDEHTWGASTAVTVPTGAPALNQWEVKSGFAASADIRARDLLSRALALSAAGDAVASTIDVFNPTSWTRSGMVMVARDLSAGGDEVRDDQGAVLRSQRLAHGELAVEVRDVPAFSSRRYTIARRSGGASGDAIKITDHSLDNGLVSVVLDPKTGGIVELHAHGGPNLVDAKSGRALNEYLYFNGNDTSKARSNGPVTIKVKEKGPLIASLVVESEAPGCFALSREIKLVAGEGMVEISNLVDKQRLVAASYREPDGKESVNFAFPFNIPDGQVRLEVPYGVVRPDADQIPGACKNWFSVDRWADVSNADLGITWITLDTPLVQVGGLTANLLNSQTNPAVWRKKVGPTQQLYAWVMNNHWGTNYRAFQEGPTLFRFVLRPHGRFDSAEATRAAIAASQPLLAARAHAQPARGVRPSIQSSAIIVTGFKPSDDGKAVILRLWNATEKEAQARVEWGTPAPRRVMVSDTSEQPGRDAGDSVTLAGWQSVTLRADLP